MLRTTCLAVVSVLVLGLSTLTGTTPTAYAAAPRAATEHPEPLLKSSAQGKAAVRALGEDLEEAARRNQMTAAQLEHILTTDSSAEIYPSGKLAYVDVRRESSAPTTSAALTVLEVETFTLHSLPGSKHTIFLDFDGADVTNSGWNYHAEYNPDGIPDGFYDAFSIDGNTNDFSTAEHEYIQEVWRVVSENYATFDVDVTTEDPGPDAYNRNGPTDPTYGTHVLFTDDPDSNSLCQPGVCGGKAFVDVFDDIDVIQDFYEPAWVREYPNATDAAIAASHEVGHTLGLTHDGRTSPSEAYYQGAGAWSPIMGAGPNAIQQFSKGEYPNANNPQDDLADITRLGGLPPLPDDAGNTIATANTMGALTSFTIEGIISNRTDYDVYKIGTCTNPITVAANGTGIGSALDLRVDALNSSGGSLGSSDPASGQAAGSPPVATGVDVPAFAPTTAPTYYVKVDGVGNPAANGYTDYGSIGSYTLTISGCVAANGTAPGAPTGLAFANTKSAATISWNAPASPGSTSIDGYRVTGLPSGPFEVPAGTTSKAVTTNGGIDLELAVVAFNDSGPGAAGGLNTHVDSWAPTTPPTVTVTTKVLTASLAWKLGASPGGSVVTAWRVKESVKVTDLPVPDFQYGVKMSYSDYGTHTVTITPLVYAEDGSTSPGRTVTFAIATKPSAPRIGTASRGARGKPVTATARWGASYNGGAKITAYKVVAYKLNSRGKIVSSKTSKALSGNARAYSFRLRAGRYKFRVVAYNIKGASPGSKYSKVVTAR